MKTMAVWAGLAGLLATLASAATFGPLFGSADTSELATQPSQQSAANALPSLALPPGKSRSSAPAELVAARPFHFKGSARDESRAAECLALAAWYEAGDDPVGQRAVIQTVVNRVNNAAFPKSFCGVIFEGSHLATGCQFTFTCDGSLQHRRPSRAARERALALSRKALAGAVEPAVGDATHYHADYVSPWWSTRLERLTQVGSHIFYRWRGANGSLAGRIRQAPEAELAELIEQSNATASETDLATLNGPGTVPLSAASPLKVSDAAAHPQRPTDSALLVKVGDARASGSWALSALKSCGSRASCQVLGYSTQALVEQNSYRAAASRDRPVFLFIRDGASGMELALWDCEQISRPSERQCLPSRRDALERLLRDRSGV